MAAAGGRAKGVLPVQGTPAEQHHREPGAAPTTPFSCRGHDPVDGSALITGLRFNFFPGGGGAAHNRIVDESPGNDVNACIQIGVPGVAAREAEERCLARAVVGVNEPADTTLLAYVRLVDHLHQNPGPSGLVLDEGSDLMERPPVMPRSCRVFVTVVHWRMPVRSSRAIPRFASPVAQTILLLTTWFVLVLNRRSRPEILRSFSLASSTPFCCRTARSRP